MHRRTPLVGIYREELFSPQREQADATILKLTGEALTRRGFPVEIMGAEGFNGRSKAPLIFTMGRGRSLLQTLRKYEEEGILIINCPSAIYNCYRTNMIPLLAQASLPFPRSHIISVAQFLNSWERRAPKLKHLIPSLGCGFWVKRGDVHAIKRTDVSFVQDELQLQRLLEDFQQRGITEAIFQEHIEGTAVKFYALKDGPLLDCLVTQSQNQIALDREQLAFLAGQAAEILGLDVYGGDCIVTEASDLYLIDINDWPSFATCQSRAAEAIAEYIITKGKAEGVL